MKKKKQLNKIIEIYEFDIKSLWDLDLYEKKTLLYNNDENFFRYIIKKHSMNVIDKFSRINDKTCDIWIQFCRYAYRCTLDKEKELIHVECLAPCDHCNSSNTEFYFDHRQKEKYQKVSESDPDIDFYDAFCFDCGQNFKI